VRFCFSSRPGSSRPELMAVQSVDVVKCGCPVLWEEREKYGCPHCGYCLLHCRCQATTPRFKIEVIEVWRHTTRKPDGTEGKTYTLFHGKGVSDIFALGSDWCGITPAEGCFYWVEASRSQKGPWSWCRYLELDATHPLKKIVPPVLEPRPHHVENLPDTQRTAYELLKPKLPEKKKKVLRVIVDAGTSDKANLQDMEIPMHAPKHTFSGRVSELKRDGWIVDTGRRVERHGQWFTVYAATQQALDFFTQPEWS